MVDQYGQDALDRLDRYFHDCEMVLNELRYDDERKEMYLPIIAPDPDLTNESRLTFPFIRKTVVLKKWSLVVFNVEEVDVQWDSNCRRDKNVELGSVRVESPGKIVIEGHYAVAVVISVSAVSADLVMTDETVATETRIRIGFRCK